MGCFLVPVAEAVAVTVITKVMKAKEEKLEPMKIEGVEQDTITEVKIPFSRKLKWLSNMLWGGSALLAFEHVWHGEVVAWFPFLTAAGDPAEAAVMLNEMATVGVSMAALLTAIWGVMLLVSRAMEKKALASLPTAD